MTAEDMEEEMGEVVVVVTSKATSRWCLDLKPADKQRGLADDLIRLGQNGMTP